MIEVKGLNKYFGPVKALDGVDLQINEGPPTGLVGPNGAGKTTLFSVLCGFLNPTAGTVKIAGHPPLASALHGQIAILPQDAALQPAVAVAKQLAFMAELQGFSRRTAATEAARVLELVNLSESAHQPPESLSHGMKKRAAIAQAFIGTPDLILLDEPTAGLDPNTAAPIRELIRTTAAERKFVISSHNLSDIEDLCGDVVILKKGKVSDHSAIDALVGRTSALTVTLEATAPDSVESLCSSIAEVDKVEVLGGDRMQVRVYFDEANETEVHVGMLQALKGAGIGFKEMSRGESLESRVREITR
ncbi:MAG: ABC transporter ATP-binding protein [Woeseiaceae bacterium]